MSHQEKSNPAATGLTLLSRVIRLLAHTRSGSHSTEDFSASDQSGKSTRNLAFSGGYNEAFVMQFWASYNPRH